MPIITSPADLRAAARRGEWRGTTGGHCPAYQQTNVVILPQESAAEFAAFCTRNPRPCRSPRSCRRAIQNPFALPQALTFALTCPATASIAKASWPSSGATSETSGAMIWSRFYSAAA